MDHSAATPGAETLVAAGAAIVDQAGTVRGLRNAGDEPLVLLTLSIAPGPTGMATPEAGTPAP